MVYIGELNILLDRATSEATLRHTSRSAYLYAGIHKGAEPILHASHLQTNKSCYTPGAELGLHCVILIGITARITIARV